MASEISMPIVNWEETCLYAWKEVEKLKADRNRLAEETTALRARVAELEDMISSAVGHFFLCGAGVHTAEDECGQFVPAMADLAKAIDFYAAPDINAEIAAIPPSQRTAARTLSQAEPSR